MHYFWGFWGIKLVPHTLQLYVAIGKIILSNNSSIVCTLTVQCLYILRIMENIVPLALSLSAIDAVLNEPDHVKITPR